MRPLPPSRTVNPLLYLSITFVPTLLLTLVIIVTLANRAVFLRSQATLASMDADSANHYHNTVRLIEPHVVPFSVLTIYRYIARKTLLFRALFSCRTSIERLAPAANRSLRRCHRLGHRQNHITISLTSPILFLKCPFASPPRNFYYHHNPWARLSASTPT